MASGARDHAVAVTSFTVAMRDEMLAAEPPRLPHALRCPPVRSPSAHVLASLATADGVIKPKVLAWLKRKNNRSHLLKLVAAYRSHVGANWPTSHAKATFNNMVRQTLMGLQPNAPKANTGYLITKRLRLLHDARRKAVAAYGDAKTAEDAGFCGLCVCDHYIEGQPGPWFQLHLLSRLVLALEHLGVLTASPQSDADCPICFAKVEGVGHPWYQLEPCRHFICGACADEYMQERGEDTCPQCRQQVVLYVHAKSGT